jgi:CelD/BcsL family acetyltransferase involved in cellulose biosynthesis
MKWAFYPASEFEAHANSWDALNQCGFDTPLLSRHFVLHALRNLASGREKLAVLGSPDSPDAMCILVRHRNLMWHTFQPAQAPTGFWLMRPGLDLQAALTALLQDLPGFSLAVGVLQLDPLLLTRPADTASMLTVDYIETASMTVSGDYERFLQSRSAHLRKNIRHMNNLVKNHGFSCTIQCLEKPEEVAGALAHFARLEASGWKGELGTAVRSDSAQGRFYLGLLQSFCAAEACWMYCLTFDEAIVAVDIYLHQGGTVYCLKTAFDEAYRHYSPGMLLHLAVMRRLWQSGEYRRIEFYGRIADWQLHLTEETRTMYHINVYRWGWLQRLMRLKARV